MRFRQVVLFEYVFAAVMDFYFTPYVLGRFALIIWPGTAAASLVKVMVCMAFRVPTVVVFVVDLTCEVEERTSHEEIYAKFKRRLEHNMKGFVGYCE